MGLFALEPEDGGIDPDSPEYDELMKMRMGLVHATAHQ
jgi:hypothetical protein